MRPAVAVRPAHPGDYLPLGRVLLRSIKAGYPWVTDWWVSDADLLTYPYDDHGKWRHLLVAESEGRLAGLSCLLQDYIDEFFVDPDFWGRGVADALMEESVALFPQRLDLHCFERNARGRRFYERHGFRFLMAEACPFHPGSAAILYRRGR